MKVTNVWELFEDHSADFAENNPKFKGMNPSSMENDNSPVKIERYKMLMAFLAMNGTD